MRYTNRYRLLMMDCVDLAEKLSGMPERDRLLKRRRKRPSPQEIQSQLAACNAEILRERMKTMVGDDVRARAERTIAALEATV